MEKAVCDTSTLIRLNKAGLFHVLKIISSKMAGLIPSVKSALDHMIEAGEGIDNTHYFETLEQAGEAGTKPR